MEARKEEVGAFHGNRRTALKPTFKEIVMNTSKLVAIAAFSALAAFGAHADEADGSQLPHAASSARSAAEVRAEAVNPAKIGNGSTGVHAIVESKRTPQAVRADAAAAARTGMTSRGEI